MAGWSRHAVGGILRRHVAVVMAVGLLAGCSKPARSTTMTVEDYQEIAVEMSAKLRESEFLRERTPQSPRMVIAINKVENLTSDMIPVGAQWYLQERVKNSMPIATLSRDKNIVFTIPAEHLREAKASGEVEQDAAALRNPTHAMTATFLSVTRAARKDRTDLYYCEYKITDLKSGELVWTDKFEFKRAAVGRSWD